MKTYREQLADHLATFDYDSLNPGVRKLVRLLNEAGFATTDSGDGGTSEFECDRGYAYVVIVPDWCRDMVRQARDIRDLLIERGVSFSELSEMGTEPYLYLDYNPVDESVFIHLMNVTDSLLTGV